MASCLNYRGTTLLHRRDEFLFQPFFVADHFIGRSIVDPRVVKIWILRGGMVSPDRHVGHARIDNRPANEVIGDEKWLKEEFIATVQQRGAAVIKARGLSSAGSAANAIIDTVNSLTT